MNSSAPTPFVRSRRTCHPTYSPLPSTPSYITNKSARTRALGALAPHLSPDLLLLPSPPSETLRMNPPAHALWVRSRRTCRPTCSLLPSPPSETSRMNSTAYAL
jgi:hypothetical protein